MVRKSGKISTKSGNFHIVSIASAPVLINSKGYGAKMIACSRFGCLTSL